MASVNHLFLAQQCEEVNEVDLPSLISEGPQIAQKLLQIFHFSVESGHVVMIDFKCRSCLKKRPKAS